MSLIVVEGVDASGKTTLLENLRSIRGKYFLEVRHSCRPLKSSDIIRLMQTVRNMSDVLDVVLDRHPLISEPIYGPILRNKDLTADLYNMDNRDRKLLSTVKRVIYCRPPEKSIFENLSNRPQLKGVLENIHQLIEAYDNRMKELRQKGLDIVVYDYHVLTDFEHLLYGAP